MNINIDDHKKISGSSLTIIFLSLLHVARWLFLLKYVISAWFTVPVCPPSLCTIFLVLTSQI